MHLTLIPTPSWTTQRGPNQRERDSLSFSIMPLNEGLKDAAAADAYISYTHVSVSVSLYIAVLRRPREDDTPFLKLVVYIAN